MHTFMRPVVILAAFSFTFSGFALNGHPNLLPPDSCRVVEAIVSKERGQPADSLATDSTRINSKTQEDSMATPLSESMPPDSTRPKSQSKLIGFMQSPAFREGYSDAKTHYRGYRGLGTASFFSGFLGVTGILVPAIGGSMEPRNAHRYAPDLNRFRNDEAYAKGFLAGAKTKKQNKAWINYGIGFGSVMAFFLGVLVYAMVPN